MNSIDYIGFDIHKKTISFCAKAQDRRSWTKEQSRRDVRT